MGVRAVWFRQDNRRRPPGANPGRSARGAGCPALAASAGLGHAKRRGVPARRSAGDGQRRLGGGRQLQPVAGHLLASGAADGVLDLPLRTATWRVFRRTLQRVRSSDRLLWGMQRETVGNALLSRDSLVLWNLKVHRRRERQYSQLVREAEARGTPVVRLQSQRAVDAWLREFERRAGPEPEPKPQGPAPRLTVPPGRYRLAGNLRS